MEAGYYAYVVGHYGKHEDTLCRRCGAQEENIEHLFHCQNFKEKPLNSKNLLKTDPTKLG